MLRTEFDCRKQNFIPIDDATRSLESQRLVDYIVRLLYKRLTLKRRHIQGRHLRGAGGAVAPQGKRKKEKKEKRKKRKKEKKEKKERRELSITANYYI